MIGLKPILTAMQRRLAAGRAYYKANSDDVKYVICIILLGRWIVPVVYQYIRIIFY